MTLNADSPFILHAAQNVALILLSLAFLPLDTFFAFWSYVLTFIDPPEPLQRRRDVRSPHTPYFAPKTVLVTGVGMTKGLSLARQFHVAGHNVIGAEIEPFFLPLACGRTSRALKTFYRLPNTASGGREAQAKYTQTIVDIIRREGVHLWVSCSGVASAMADACTKEMVELVTSCKAIQFDVSTTKRLHEKHSFIDYTRTLGLPTPETHTVTSKAAALHVLAQASASKKEKRYILKYIGTDDSVRADMTLLPFPTPSETKAHISRLAISEDRPWILQQYIPGPEFCTHALIIKGTLSAFVSCPSSDLLMHYTALPPDSALSRSMQRFTEDFALASGPNFTGHLSFDFLVEREDAEKAAREPSRNVRVYPIECNPRAHTAVCLFNDTPEMMAAYLSAFDESRPQSATASPGPEMKKLSPGTPNGLATKPIVFPSQPTPRYYWIGHALVTLVLLPLFSLFRDAKGLSFLEIFESLGTFVEHVLDWRDGTFEFWDPVPAWWLYHIYWPTQFFMALVGRKKWSRVNVSTGKMFMC
jgi:catechol O-methyltransferase